MRHLCARIMRTFAIATLALALGRAAHAQHYTVTDLGPTAPNVSGVATAINDQGEVVGFTLGYVNEGFFYSNGVTQPVGMSAVGRFAEWDDMATAINNQGQFIYNGSVNGSDFASTSIIQNGVVTTLPKPANTIQIWGLGINNSGWVVGPRLTGPPHYNYLGYLYHGGQFSDLGTLGGAFPYTIPNAINDKGQVVGESSSKHGSIDAFLFQLSSSGKVVSRTDLGKPAQGTSSVAYAINNQGEAVGAGYLLSNTEQRPLLWSNGKMTVLDLLPNETFGFAKGINDDGQVVGGDYQPGYLAEFTARAFLYSSGVLKDLNDLISDKTWVLQFANAINNNGQIVGRGVHNGETHAFLLTPQ